jgi:hypothetical protein
MLLSYDPPGSPTHTNESMETTNSFWVSKEKALFVSSEEQNQEKILLKLWGGGRIGYKIKKKEENQSLQASRDFPLL